jgi:D-glycero-D-manno-heptose 1,7-bisphosphate phosphatase
MNKAFFLDRDGVINEAIVRNGKPYPPFVLEEVKILPGVPEALMKLHQAGYMIFIVTNQPDVTRLKQSKTNVEAIHAFLSKVLPINEFLVCYHDDKDHCNCRKPKPGLLVEAAQRYNIDLAASFMVGDRWRDIDAGFYAGCFTIFVDNHYDEKLSIQPDWMVSSLSQAVDRFFSSEIYL